MFHKFNSSSKFAMLVFLSAGLGLGLELGQGGRSCERWNSALVGVVKSSSFTGGEDTMLFTSFLFVITMLSTNCYS